MDDRCIRLEHLLNDIDRDTLTELFGGAPLAAVEAALSEGNGKPCVHCLVRKRAAEIAIENSEAVALAWLQDARARAEGAP